MDTNLTDIKFDIFILQTLIFNFLDFTKTLCNLNNYFSQDDAGTVILQTKLNRIGNIYYNFCYHITIWYIDRHLVYCKNLFRVTFKQFLT